jgi:2-keto-4-pentenoate hydratase/2-oxohepta-3-ene-1,7-dioic acid hydratase in catechol pathway
MRFVTYLSQLGPRIAGQQDGGYVDLNRADAGLPSTMRALLSLGRDGLSRAAAALPAGEPFDPEGVKLLAPVPNPEKVICIGLNYADHAEETGAAVPEEPVVFAKFPSAIAGDGDDIVLPRLSKEVDFEAELVVVIGAGGRHIPREDALQHVAGYACGQDVSARDWQLHKPGGQWLLGKTFDGFAPFGPALVTPDEVGDPSSLEITLRLNDQVMQQSSTSQLIFPIDHLVSYVSGVCTLRPGDVIFTGTPPGVGMGRKPPVFLQAGDEVEVEIEKVGRLRDRFVAEP